MSVKILIDMNLPPSWVQVLERQGWSAIHWSTVGDPRATDRDDHGLGVGERLHCVHA